MIVEITLAELRERNACDPGYDFAAALADAAGVVRLDLSSPLAWVWLESHGRAWASWIGLRAPTLSGAYLGGADLRGANLSGADLYGAYLGWANLSRANLSGAYLRGAYLGGADLRGANLSGADLYWAYLGGADLGSWERGPDGYARRRAA